MLQALRGLSAKLFRPHSSRLGWSILTALILVHVGSAAQAQDLKGQTLHLYTYGGSYLEAVQDLVIKPFEAETGVKVVVDDSCCNKFAAAMTAGQYAGDVILGQDHGRLLNYAKLGWLIPDKRFEEAATA